jgi:hypothetical protein
VNGLTVVQGRATHVGANLRGPVNASRERGVDVSSTYGVRSRLHGNPISTKVRTGIDRDNDRID